MKQQVLLGSLLYISATWLPAQIAVNGLADRGIYDNAVTFTIVSQAGYNYAAFLNGNPVPVGTSVSVPQPDFYLLQIFRTNQVNSQVTNQLVRFIVEATERGGTELGLPRMTPLPVIQSASNELAEAQLRLLLPARFPAGYPVPLVAWVMNQDNHPVRANGRLVGAQHLPIQIRRGVGSGFLSSNLPPGTLTYVGRIQGLATNQTIEIEAESAWTSVSGIISSSTIWPEGARISVDGNLTIANGATLTIGPESVLRLNPRVDITNNGRILINGTVTRPVVFMPRTPGQPWGGFIMRRGTGEIEGSGVVFTGSGAVANWFGANGNPGSHRVEQALFYVENTQRVSLTDSAAIYLAGQLGHAYAGGTFIFNRFLLQHATTGGEYTGANFTVNDSAFIEFPEDSPTFENGDHDALYLVSGTHAFTNTLFGWTKDDGIDSGGSGYGRLRYQSCWFEGIFHEGNSLSGYKDVLAQDTVYIDCGQGIENGYNAPTNVMVRCLFTGCLSGLRHGDNYEAIADGYKGYETASNSLVIFNHRDVFGYNWRNTGWTNATGQMTIVNNWLTRAHPDFPNNLVWNPAEDGWRLAAFGAAGQVGVALATRGSQFDFAQYAARVPVRLSIFCTNPVQVDFTLEASESATFTSLTNGTLTFPPGQTVQWLELPDSVPATFHTARLRLSNPVNAEVTGPAATYYFRNFLPATPPPLVAAGSEWKYLDTGVDQGTAWRLPDFDDEAWPAGPAELGFGDGDEATVINGGPSNARFPTAYFRHRFTVADPHRFESLRINLRRDDGAIVYLNGLEVFRSNMPTGAVNHSTYTGVSANPENAFYSTTIPATNLVTGDNILAVEVHQQNQTSSDLSFALELLGLGPDRPRLDVRRPADVPVLFWFGADAWLEQSTNVTGPWEPVLGVESPVLLQSGETRFYRLRRP